jgi:hypothetical protein
MTARYAHLAPTHKLNALERLVPSGTDSVQGGHQNDPLTKTGIREGKKAARKVQGKKALNSMVSV